MYSREKASKVSHIDVMNNDLVSSILEQIEIKEGNSLNHDIKGLKKIDFILENPKEDDISSIIVVDGSNTTQKVKDLSCSFIKTGYMILYPDGIKKLSNRRLDNRLFSIFLDGNAEIHSTFIPLSSRFSIAGKDLANSVREILYLSFVEDNTFDYKALKALKYMMFKKWNNNKEPSRAFECPHKCKNQIRIPYNKNKTICEACGNEVYITDYIGFHKLFESSNYIPDKLVVDYMLLHETLTLFYFILYYYLLEKSRYRSEKANYLKNILFLKDGPLSLSYTYTNVILDINEFLSHLREENYNLNLCGQEKTGNLVEYFSNYKKDNKLKESSNPKHNEIIFIDDKFIQESINPKALYYTELHGRPSTYGSKICVVSQGERIILSLNTGGKYISYPDEKNLLNLERILKRVLTVRTLTHNGALYPIRAINDKVSLAKGLPVRMLEEFLREKLLLKLDEK